MSGEEGGVVRAIHFGNRPVSRLVVLAVALVTVSTLVSSAFAAPIPEGTFVAGSWSSNPSYLFFLTPAGTLSGGLTSLGCPFLPQPAPTEAETSQLRYAYDGWTGPIQNADTNPSQQVLLRTRVAGTVQDTSGTSYTITGHFTDSTTHYLFDPDLLFDGFGEVTLAGGGGVVVGTAELRLVDAPLDYAFVFTSIRRCTIGGPA
jgi:hypothetical protein